MVHVRTWPNCVVNTQKDNHVVSWIKIHDLHCPKWKHIFLVKKYSLFARVFDPFYFIQEYNRPFIWQLRNIHRLQTTNRTNFNKRLARISSKQVICYVNFGTGFFLEVKHILNFRKFAQRFHNRFETLVQSKLRKSTNSVI